MNKAVFFDLDGTLLNSHNEITIRTHSSVSKLKKEYEVFLVTGKSFENTKNIYEKLGLKTELITYGGKVVSKKIQNKWTHKKTYIDFEDIKNVLKDQEVKNDIKHFLIETENVLFKSGEKVNNVVHLLKSQNQKVKFFTDYNNESILGFYFNIDKKEEQENLRTINLFRSRHKILSFSYWYTDYPFTTVSVSPKNISKWKVIKKLKEKYNFEFIITFGNGYTDVEMIKNANIGYAMKNAFDSVQKHAHKVTEFDNDHDGVAIEIDKIINKITI